MVLVRLLIKEIIKIQDKFSELELKGAPLRLEIERYER